MTWSDIESAEVVRRALGAMPIVAILRGLTPDEAVGIGEALVAAGVTCLEVPLNSPDPLVSIRRLRDALDGRAVVGAGTVLDEAAVGRVADAGGQLMVAPNTDAEVIRAARRARLYALPGVFTPTEAFTALNAGADALKLFPAETSGPAGLRAMRAVLPPSTSIYAVGGVTPVNLAEWRRAGATGAGIGSALYRPGCSAAEVAAAAGCFVVACQASLHGD